MASGHAPIGAWFSQIGRLHEVHHVRLALTSRSASIKRCCLEFVQLTRVLLFFPRSLTDVVSLLSVLPHVSALMTPVRRHYPSLEARRLKRKEAWKIDNWSATVSKVPHNPSFPPLPS